MRHNDSKAGEFLALLVILSFYPQAAHAFFGIDCSPSSSIDKRIAEKGFTENISIAVKSSCDFLEKNELLIKKYPKGWKLSRFPEMQQDVRALEKLGETAVAQNYATNDNRARDNIRQIYIDIGENIAWLYNSEELFKEFKKNMAAEEIRRRRRYVPGGNYDGGYDSYQPPRQGLSNRGVPCFMPSERMLGGC